MIRIGLLPILIPFVALPLSSCTSADTERVVAAVTGNSPPTEQYALAANTNAVPIESSVEEVAVVVPVVSPPPPPCENYQWRAWIYDCHGNNIGDAP